MKVVSRSIIWLFAIFELVPIVQAQQPGYRLSIQPQVSYSLILGNLAEDGFPFGLSTNGINMGVSTQLWWSDKWAFNLSGSYSSLPYDVSEAAEFFLSDQNVEMVTVRAVNFSVWDFSAGVVYRWQVSDRLSLQTNVGLGMATLFTPEIDVQIIRAPHMELLFRPGSGSGVMFQFGLAPGFELTPQLDLVLSLGVRTASPTIKLEASDWAATSQDLSYMQWTIGLGCNYRFIKRENEPANGLSGF